jgi:dCMP deaminase
VPGARPSWDEYFFALAAMAATRATCPRASVGSVLVKEKRVIGTGYNGSEPGAPHCVDVGCLLVNNHCQRVVHSEVNALRNAVTYPYGATLYCTLEPCRTCRLELAQAGVTDLRWNRAYKDVVG